MRSDVAPQEFEGFRWRSSWRVALARPLRREVPPLGFTVLLARFVRFLVRGGGGPSGLPHWAVVQPPPFPLIPFMSNCSRGGLVLRRLLGCRAASGHLFCGAEARGDGLLPRLATPPTHSCVGGRRVPHRVWGPATPCSSASGGGWSQGGAVCFIPPGGIRLSRPTSAAPLLVGARAGWFRPTGGSPPSPL